MNIERILQTRTSRKTRGGHPLNIFRESFNEIKAACLAIENNELPKFSHLLERSAIISLVTSIEVYYRDMLDGVFRHCKHSFFSPLVKHFCKTKYDIDDLIVFHEKQIHPLELVASQLNFQNIEAIDAVFSKVIGRGFFSSLLDLRIRVRGKPETESGFVPADLDALKRVFAVRHEIVHSPAHQCSYLNKTLVEDIDRVGWVIYGSDTLLMKVINDNLDDEVAEMSAKKQRQESK